MPDKVEPAPYGDFVLPFDMAKVGVRGRLVRLDAASARALSAHALPEPAARVAGEVVALGTLLGTALKLDGRLTIQTKGDGPLDLVTADYYGADENRARGVRGGKKGFEVVDRAGGVGVLHEHAEAIRAGRVGAVVAGDHVDAPGLHSKVL